jgi:flagellar L-ring protein FlgH
VLENARIYLFFVFRIKTQKYERCSAKPRISCVLPALFVPESRLMRTKVLTIPYCYGLAKMRLTQALVDSKRYVAHARSPRIVWRTLADMLVVLVFAIGFLSIVSGCSHIEPRVAMPAITTAAPQMPEIQIVNNGAIFQAAGVHRPLFEDQKPRYVGDILTVAIQERTNASRSSKSSTNKTGEVKASVPILSKVPGKFVQGLDAKGTSANTFEGKGETANDNAFSGTITVTVVGVLPNGNLAVAGEKQIGINANTEIIRFSGVVNPTQVQTGNVVASSQVADARLEYRGKGYIDEAQRMGWLQRFFLTFLPF